MIRGVPAPRFRPFFAHFPPSLARSLRLGARTPGSAKERRKNGGKRAQNGVETGVSDPYIRMPQPWRDGAPDRPSDAPADNAAVPTRRRSAEPAACRCIDPGAGRGRLGPRRAPRRRCVGGCYRSGCLGPQGSDGGFSRGPAPTPVVGRHDIAAIWVAFFSRWQRYRCSQGRQAGAGAWRGGGASGAGRCSCDRANARNGR